MEINSKAIVNTYVNDIVTMMNDVILSYPSHLSHSPPVLGKWGEGREGAAAAAEAIDIKYHHIYLRITLWCNMPYFKNAESTMWCIEYLITLTPTLT